MIKILNISATIVFGLLVVTFLAGYINYGYFSQISKTPKLVIFGAVCYLICNNISTPFISVNLKRYKVSVHESIHIMVALLFGKQVIESRTSHNNGGHMKHQGGFNFPGVGMLISLAPYFLSYLVGIFILLKIITLSSISGILYFLIGFVWAFHLMTFYEQSVGFYFRNNRHQSDIAGSHYYSKYTAYTFILLMNLIINGMILLFLINKGYLVDDFLMSPVKVLKSFV